MDLYLYTYLTLFEFNLTTNFFFLLSLFFDFDFFLSDRLFIPNGFFSVIIENKLGYVL